ncbi:hypothetical protein QOZ80_9BG0707130 [Eleusine coracana subsp. coracana]|nr:hypothetical protein QOZ80_9BG0707130 [Eleusine coracana subsp. coracana]
MEMVAGTLAPEMTPEQEMAHIRDITVAAEAEAKEGDTFFLITTRWWQSWIDYVIEDSTSNGSHLNEFSSKTQRRPGAIDNTDLIDDTASDEISSMEIELHDTLVEGRDYILLPQQVWETLHGWYGGGPTLPRKAINSGFSQTDLAIEVYPLRLQLLLMPKGERAVIRISKKDTVGELHKKACCVFNLIPDEVCIWDYYNRTKHTLMDNLEKTLDDANIQMDQDILVEITADANGSLDGGCMSLVKGNAFFDQESDSLFSNASKLGYSNENLPTQNYASRSYSSDMTQNLYFRSSNGDLDNVHGSMTDYHREINRQNPLGNVGELAVAFGDLLRKLWTSSRSPVSPRPFKTKLSRFASQFSGCNQHDSQELLAFLLDGLHEDLNRVKHRPYINSGDTDGRSDEEVADEYWANHIARNNSIIVDVCQGQYKSTLVCPVCGKVSVTFDPFMYLSLPLQFASNRSITVMVFSCDGSVPPTPYTVSVPKQGRCRDLLHALSNACSLTNWEKLLIAEIRNHKIYRFLDDPVLELSTISDDNHLAVYRLPKLEKKANYIQFVHRRDDMEHGNNSGLKPWKPYGVPLLAQISRNETVSGYEVFKFAPPAKRTRGEPLSLYACLDAFLREEPLVPEEMWYCPRCKEQRQASKKLDLWRLPDVLVIHLKRFSFSRSTKQKLETFVNFPIHDLDFTNYIANKKSSGRQIYELYAVSNHYGSMASGHYTAHIKLLQENRWYNFDDSQVVPIDEEEVKSAAAYVLFYRRVREQDAANKVQTPEGVSCAAVAACLPPCPRSKPSYTACALVPPPSGAPIPPSPPSRTRRQAASAPLPRHNQPAKSSPCRHPFTRADWQAI